MCSRSYLARIHANGVAAAEAHEPATLSEFEQVLQSFGSGFAIHAQCRIRVEAIPETHGVPMNSSSGARGAHMGLSKDQHDRVILDRRYPNYSEAPEDDWEWQTELSQWLGESEAGLTTSGTSLSTVRLPGTTEDGNTGPQTCSAGAPSDPPVQGQTPILSSPLSVQEVAPGPVLQQQQRQTGPQELTSMAPPKGESSEGPQCDFRGNRLPTSHKNWYLLLRTPEKGGGSRSQASTGVHSIS